MNMEGLRGVWGRGGGGVGGRWRRVVGWVGCKLEPSVLILKASNDKVFLIYEIKVVTVRVWVLTIQTDHLIHSKSFNRNREEVGGIHQPDPSMINQLTL